MAEASTRREALESALAALRQCATDQDTAGERYMAFIHHLPTVARLAYECPFPDIVHIAAEFLGEVKQVPP